MTRSVLGLAAILGLFLFPFAGATVEAHGNPPSFVVATSPAPAPAPSPGPGPGPAPGPSGGLTPGSGGGGATPGGAPGGGTTPGAFGGGGPAPAGGARGGTTPGGRGGAPGAFGRGGGRTKAKFTRPQSHWLGAVTLPWEGTFLPTAAEAGYEERELTFDQAIAGEGGAAAWNLKPIPTLIAVYDPSSKPQMKTLWDLDQNKSFVAAAHYFNLVRIDVRTLKDQGLRKQLAKQLTFLVFRAKGEQVATVAMTRKARLKDVLAGFDTVFQKDYGVPTASAIDRMGRTLAREAWVKDALKRNEQNVICPDCGGPVEPVQEGVRKLREEMRQIEATKASLTKVNDGALATR